MGRQLEGAKPYWVDCHLQNRVSTFCKTDFNQMKEGLYVEKGFYDISPHGGRVLSRLSGQQWAQACPRMVVKRAVSLIN